MKEEIILNCTNITNNKLIENNFLKNTVTRTIFLCLYLVIFVLGFFGNSVVCHVVFKKKMMRTITNLFIANLAISDILLCIFCVTLTPIYTINGEWTFGEILCHSTAFLQCFCKILLSEFIFLNLIILRIDLF